jgi:hypothetical protein
MDVPQYCRFGGRGWGLRKGWHVEGKKEELMNKFSLEGVCSSINILLSNRIYFSEIVMN